MYMDPLYPHNQLILGDGAKIEGVSTPVEFFNGLYFLTLDGISVGDKQLDIDPQTFRRTASGNGGVIIDSRATLTYLARGGFEPLRAEVQRLADGLLQPVEMPGLKVPCYNGVIERDLVGFPWVVFHFAGGVELGLDTESMFVEITSNQFCMAVMPSEGGVEYYWSIGSAEV
ncbi:aspartic proteinase nepenthesin-1-like [Corylus avellana]|uniref:aspartic proteinase nepenthesin-1-like n=1 Tax=Corylus avellana TaxID=13451 RepID=UPI00286B9D37|nr:aspartic proteinase nepenthesin-1-like [Corylus avellana]